VNGVNRVSIAPGIEDPVAPSRRRSQECSIGKPIVKVDAWEKATGEARYPTDNYPTDALYLHLVRADVAHGLIRSIDAAPALALAGVLVFTADDVPVNSHGSIIKDQPVLAKDRVRFYGEPVAIVAAPDARLAEKAAAMVKVRYDPLPVINTPAEALSPQAVALHDQGNLLHEIHISRGDVEAARDKSYLILEDTFNLPVVDHVCLEPEGGVAFWDQETLTLDVGTQNPFYDQSEIARVLELPKERVRVRCKCTGGGFGGKDGNTVQLFLALVAWKTGRPCRLVFSRPESLMATYKRHAAQIWARMAFSEDGGIVSLEARLDFDTGAYAALGQAVIGLAAEICSGAYRVPAIRVDAYLAYTNKPPASAMRGFGGPQVAFATESLINRACRSLGLDPIAVRRLNALCTGDVAPMGHRMCHCLEVDRTLDQLSLMSIWQERSNNPEAGVGYGMALGLLGSGMGKGIPDAADVEIEQRADGTYLVRAGVVDIGQGNRTAFTQIAAEALGVPPEIVEVTMADTDATHDCGTTAASRTTYIVGKAVILAAEDLHRNVQAGGPARGRGRSVFPEVPEDLSYAPGMPHSMYSLMAQAVKVRIDAISGNVEILGIDSVTEAGKVLNPAIMAGQSQGAIAMAAGYALLEEMVYREGVPQMLDLHTYLLPTFMDLPDIAAATVEAEEQSGPYGVKGCAELGTIALAPAIAAAVMDLLDWAPTSLPIGREELKRVSDKSGRWIDASRARAERRAEG
jgi:xanthine dehydrogenase molybdenum-binding subunit